MFYSHTGKCKYSKSYYLLFVITGRCLHILIMATLTLRRGTGSLIAPSGIRITGLPEGVYYAVIGESTPVPTPLVSLTTHFCFVAQP